MTPVERIRRQLERRVRDTAPELGAEILRAWDRLAATMEGEAFRRLVAQSLTLGSPDPILAQLLTDDVLDRVFSEVARQQFSNVNDALNFWGKQHVTATGSTIGITFGTLSPEVLEAIRTGNLKMATALKDDVRGAVRTAVQLGLEEGVNPRTMARGLRQTVGLTEPQVRWVHNFRRELEAGDPAALNRALARGVFTKPDGSLGYRAGHAAGVGVGKRDMELLRRTLGTDERLNGTQIDRIVDAYQRRLTAWHSESLARTAALDAQRMGQHMATKQAIADGILDAERMMSRWATVKDSRVRDEHAAMEGEVTRFDEPFSNGQTIPGETDYNCRCIKVDFQARQPATTG